MVRCFEQSTVHIESCRETMAFANACQLSLELDWQSRLDKPRKFFSQFPLAPSKMQFPPSLGVRKGCSRCAGRQASPASKTLSDVGRVNGASLQGCQF